MPNPESVQYIMRKVDEWNQPRRPRPEPFEHATDICHECGQEVKRNWYARHLRAGCTIGGRGWPDGYLVEGGRRVAALEVVHEARLREETGRAG